MTEHGLENRVILVTGASGNLGRAVCALLERQGARLARTGRRAADLIRPEAALEVAEGALKAHGRIDGLVHTVGAFAGGRPSWQADLDEWERMFAVNLRTTVNMVRAAAPPMIAQGFGRIVAVGARAGLQAMPNHAAYSAAKAALLRFVEALAGELKGAGVTANCVLPGTMDTPENRAAMPDADPARWVSPQAVAAAIAFLLSDAAGEVTGAAIPVYGAG